jgi:hypothetical protein
VIKNLTPPKTLPLGRLRHEVLIDADRHRAADKWCTQMFGIRYNPLDHRDGVWAMFWAGTHVRDKYRVCFTHEQDLAWFKLAWA